MGRFRTTPYAETGATPVLPTQSVAPQAELDLAPACFDLEEFEPIQLAQCMTEPSETDLFAKIARVKLGQQNQEHAFDPTIIHVIEEFPHDSRFAWYSIRNMLRTNPEAVDYFYFTENGIRKLAITTKDALVEVVQEIPYPCAIGLADRFLDSVEGNKTKYYDRVKDWTYADSLLYFASLGIHPIDFFEEQEILENVPCAYEVAPIIMFLQQGKDSLNELLDVYTYLYDSLCPRGTDTPNFFGSALHEVIEYLKEKGYELNFEQLSVEFLLTPVVVFPEAAAILSKKAKKAIQPEKLKTKWATTPSVAFMETSLRMKDEEGELVVISRNHNLADKYRNTPTLLN